MFNFRPKNIYEESRTMEIRCLVPLLLLAVLSAITSDNVCYCQSRFPDCLKSDLEALMDFKAGLEDPEKRLSTWKGKNCCEWYGIRCNNKTGAVSSINLRNPFPVSFGSSPKFGFWNLSGEIRPSLLKLKSLIHLDLSLNTFNGNPIPEFLGSLKNLRYLNLSDAGYSGLIPPSLGNLSNLQFLDVSSDFQSLSSDSLEWMAGLVSLQHLSMNRVDLSLIGPNWTQLLNNLPSLKKLSLSACGLSGSISTPSFINLAPLSSIDLSINTFNSEFPNWLVNISTLAYVDLSFCGLYGRIPLGLGDLPNLWFLNLNSNNNLSASFFQLFKKPWKRIKVVQFSGNKLRGKLPLALGNIENLEKLDLSDNNGEGGIPSTIGKLCNLEDFDLSGNNMNGTLPEHLEGTEGCGLETPLPRLKLLRLSNNRLTGTLPDWLGQLGNLVELTLSYNLFVGSIPETLGQLKNLTNLGLEGNKLNGSLPSNLGQLSDLSTFDVSSNHLSGFISEIHFSKLGNLKFLGLSSNSLVFNVAANWIPPFQVQVLGLGSCNLGPKFPNWLRHQKEVRYLDLSNASISDTVQNWFWDSISGNLSLLNVSFNQLQGPVPNPFKIAAFADVDLSSNLFEGSIPLPSTEIELLKLSNNRFSGQIPENMTNAMPNLIFLALSHNKLTGSIPDSLGSLLLLQVIDLSSNEMSGNIPSSISNCSYLKVLDLGNNNLSGSIPESLGQLLQLQSLHLGNNSFNGKFLSSFKNYSSLRTLDLAHNKLSGDIPHWIGDMFPELRILKLRSNAFSGVIPPEISNLPAVQVLDLARNKFTGKIPGTFGHLKAMAAEQNVIEYSLNGKYRGQYYEESLMIHTKNKSQLYTKTLSLIISIDLSENSLYGDLPEELTELKGLVVLNLSRNNITGKIPSSISRLRQLSSLDLSNNQLSGSIPANLSFLSYLGYLNLSNNNLSGQIPYMGHLTTFEESSFSGNPGLCGDPLPVKCEEEDTGIENPERIVDSDDGYIDEWFCLSLGLGFAFGILIPALMLGLRKSWREAYFSFVDKVVARLYLK